MKASDALKVLVLLLFAILVVALFCYTKVDLGMSWEQITAKIEGWSSNLFAIGFVAWSVAITLVIANRIGN